MDSWLGSVIDGQKGDVLTLLGLCMLLEKHVLVHLNGGKIWSELKTIPSSHVEALKQVDLHLVYLGRVNFIKLQLCSNLLQVLATPNSDSTTMVVVGTMLSLTLEEDKTLNKLIMSCLGIGLNRTKTSVGLPSKEPSHTASRPDAITPGTDDIQNVKQETPTVTLPISTGIATPTCSSPKAPVATSATMNESDQLKATSLIVSSLKPATMTQSKPGPASLLTTPISLKLVKMKVNPGDRIQVTQEMLDCFPIQNTVNVLKSKSMQT